MVSTYRQRKPNQDPIAELPSGRVPRKERFDGQHVNLVPLDPDAHAEDLFAASHGISGSEHIWDYLPYGPFADVEQYRSWLRTSAASSDPLFFTICEVQSGKAVGLLSFLNIVPLNGSIEVGHIMLGMGLQKTPAATEALYLLFSYAMDDLRYRRLEWKCDALNTPSRQAAVRYGFQFEGIFYNAVIVKGRNRDTSWYSIIDTEWPAVRSCFERWLDPANFDNGGKQVNALSAMTGELHSVH